ncbi:hypothetical protein [Sphingomonas jaspsi]|uniref:hypothetical protein n=1 Tax=Sphingomonas jaspsi TaxID=392409 RepID=UPI0004B45791|nr:hypothetical protein [Sphingomonas jaspsi]
MIRALPILLLLAACNREPQPEPPTATENAQLDEAGAMLDNLAANDVTPTNAAQ